MQNSPSLACNDGPCLSAIGVDGKNVPAIKHNPAYLAAYLKRYHSRAEVPVNAARDLLVEHVRRMRRRIVEGGGPDFDIMLHVDGFWNKFEQVLPPVGSYYLAWSADNTLLGTGALRTISPGVGEMKHLYVRPQARGLGLGQALVEARLVDARAMGLKILLADTFAANPEMPALYEKLGFTRVEPFDVGGTAGISPELVEHMLFFRMAL